MENCGYPRKEKAVKILTEAGKLNPGSWTGHSGYVALAAMNIAKYSALDSEKAFILGLLHDIGRRTGIVSEKHMIAGYRYCMEHGWNEAARICITHSFMIKDICSSTGVWDTSTDEYNFMKRYIRDVVYNDYDLLIQLCDSLALPSGFCLLEQRFVDVARRYGTNENTLPRWNRIFEIKDYFEQKINGSIYQLLPGIVENTFPFTNTGSFK